MYEPRYDPFSCDRTIRRGEVWLRRLIYGWWWESLWDINNREHNDYTKPYVYVQKQQHHTLTMTYYYYILWLKNSTHITFLNAKSCWMAKLYWQLNRGIWMTSKPSLLDWANIIQRVFIWQSNSGGYPHCLLETLLHIGSSFSSILMWMSSRSAFDRSWRGISRRIGGGFKLRLLPTNTLISLLPLLSGDDIDVDVAAPNILLCGRRRRGWRRSGEDVGGSERREDLGFDDVDELMDGWIEIIVDD